MKSRSLGRPVIAGEKKAFQVKENLKAERRELICVCVLYGRIYPGPSVVVFLVRASVTNRNRRERTGEDISSSIAKRVVGLVARQAAPVG